MTIMVTNTADTSDPTSAQPSAGALRTVLTPARRRALMARSDRAGLRQLAGHAVAIGLSGCWIGFRLPLWPLALPLHGVLLAFLFTALHECVHRTAFATRAWNDAVAAVCGAVLLLSPEWFRRYHLDHHRHAQDPARDPELATPKPRTWPQYLVHVSSLPNWWHSIRTLVVNAVGRPGSPDRSAPGETQGRREPYVPASAERRVTTESRVLLAVYAAIALGSIATGSFAALTLWLVPLLFGQPVLRLYLLAEHGHCPFVADAFVNTRTTFTNVLVRALAWNMPYHAEHHALPGVPFHRLPDLHRLVQPQLRTTSSGYARFSRDYAHSLGDGTPKLDG